MKKAKRIGFGLVVVATVVAGVLGLYVDEARATVDGIFIGIRYDTLWDQGNLPTVEVPTTLSGVNGDNIYQVTVKGRDNSTLSQTRVRVCSREETNTNVYCGAWESSGISTNGYYVLNPEIPSQLGTYDGVSIRFDCDGTGDCTNAQRPHLIHVWGDI